MFVVHLAKCFVLLALVFKAHQDNHNTESLLVPSVHGRLLEYSFL